MHAEITLASEIHQVLVPPIATKIGDFEFFGRSSPSGEVGGDLIDLAGTENHWVAYVADVSGHGVAPGVVMGMVKSAGRMLLSGGDDAGHLMTRLNEVLYPLKKPGLEAELQKHARAPLDAICQSLEESVNRHGARFDDQSILLIRRS